MYVYSQIKYLFDFTDCLHCMKYFNIYFTKSYLKIISYRKKIIAGQAAKTHEAQATLLKIAFILKMYFHVNNTTV